MHWDGAHSREGALTNSITGNSRFARNDKLEDLKKRQP